MNERRILLTAFEPFDAMGSNSSLEVLKQLELPWLETAILPVSYRRAAEELTHLMEEKRPDLVVCLGQAGGETTVRLEKVALNYTRAAIADNDGVLLRSGAVISGGPDAIFTKCSIEDLIDRLSAHHAIKLSLTAGSYVCNSTYYTALFRSNGNALFVHLPYCTGQGEPSEDPERMARTVHDLLLLLRGSEESAASAL